MTTPTTRRRSTVVPLVTGSNRIPERPPKAYRYDGAEQIAGRLGRTIRWVYQAREEGWSVPIRKQDGTGYYAFEDELEAWERAPESLPQKKSC